MVHVELLQKLNWEHSWHHHYKLPKIFILIINNFQKILTLIAVRLVCPLTWSGSKLRFWSERNFVNFELVKKNTSIAFKDLINLVKPLVTANSILCSAPNVNRDNVALDGSIPNRKNIPITWVFRFYFLVYFLRARTSQFFDTWFSNSEWYPIDIRNTGISPNWRVGCRVRVAIITFFHIWIWTIQGDVIAIF